ncbi:MAG: GNAT family N-acetyltransferase [Pseudomonadota bacterium]
MALPEGYSIRLFEAGDETALSAITLDTIRRIGLRYYSHDQVKVWAARHPSPSRFVDRAASGAIIHVAVADLSVPVAYTLLEVDEVGHGHLDMLYCDPQHTRKGLAEALLAKAEMVGREVGLPRLYTEASELARPAFERAGYTALHRRDFEIEALDGASIAIHNYAMEKPLN